MKLTRADKTGAYTQLRDFEFKYDGATMDVLVRDLAQNAPGAFRLLQNTPGLSGFWAFSVKIVPDNPDATKKNLEALGLRLAWRQRESRVGVIDPAK